MGHQALAYVKFNWPGKELNRFVQQTKKQVSFLVFVYLVFQMFSVPSFDRVVRRTLGMFVSNWTQSPNFISYLMYYDIAKKNTHIFTECEAKFDDYVPNKHPKRWL